MTDSSVYVVDANVLIEAKNRYYSFAICPGFWDAVVWHGVEMPEQLGVRFHWQASN